MIYWHMQMHLPEGREGNYSVSATEMLREPEPIIGTGEWNDVQCLYFKGKKYDNRGMDIGDIVLIREGQEIIALCEVISDSFLNPKLSQKYGQTNFRKVKIIDWYKGTDYFVKAQGTLERLVSKNTESWKLVNNWYQQILKNIPMQNYINLLKSKKQIILQGAPGTGKTRLAKQIAEEVIKQKSGEYEIIQFHPAYSYEDFVRGIVAKAQNNTVSYEVENKILAEFAQKAQANTESDYVLVIDEINRANLPAVLGELIYALEYRGKPVNSLYKLDGKREFVLPSNLYIIGTMNTADRSVGHIDYAIRRRFAFVSVPPDKTIITNPDALALFEKIEAIFNNNLSSEFEKDDIMIGHSYFLATGDELKIKFQYEIKPLLKEYLKDGILTCKKEDIENLQI